MQSYLQEAVTLAKEAGQLQRSRLMSGVQISFKGEIDLVTDVDRACEELIVKGICHRFPGHDILAEENTYQQTGSSHKWIIDPLDGTTNFAHGFTWFAVSIALEINGEVQLGVVYHTMMDEMFTALKGEGARVNGQPLRVSTRKPLSGCLLASGFPYDRTWDNENNFAHFLNFQMASRGVRRAGSAALDLAYVAAGRLDGYWECKLKPWDVAAGKLLVEEAGGVVTTHSGDPFSIYEHRILAANPLIHGEMLSLLAVGDKGFISARQ
jgi:myo-inositol-1(or 4)-monophosphatase